MPAFQSSRTVAFAPDQMFDLVADVERYPEFLPLCEGLNIRRRSMLEDGREVLLADMTVGYKAIRETFTSRVTLDRSKLRIDVEYVNGPFSHMENIWRFTADGNKTIVDFSINYQFKSRMLGLLMGGMFDQAFRRFADAFEKRAAKTYR
ncbi:MAG: type II toxin-antitoxin system RatA family toxin [Hyphomicrobiales bacterium]